MTNTFCDISSILRTYCKTVAVKCELYLNLLDNIAISVGTIHILGLGEMRPYLYLINTELNEKKTVQYSFKLLIKLYIFN